MHPIDREFLAEHFLLFEPVRDNQHGQSYVTEQSGTILIQINANDHVEIHVVEPSGELEKALRSVTAVEQSIEKHLPFSFSNRFGYLTSDPCQSGTGLVVNAYVHIPALIARGGYHKELMNEHQEGILFTSLQGNPEDLHWRPSCCKKPLDNRRHTRRPSSLLFAIQFKKSWQKSSLCVQRYKKRRIPMSLTTFSRAIGTLQHSFTIDTSEALRAISQVKFGIELGLVQGMTIQAINEMFFRLPARPPGKEDKL